MQRRCESAPLIEAYYIAGATEKGDALLDDYSRNLTQYVDYYMSFEGYKADRVAQDLREKLSWLSALYEVSVAYGRKQQADNIIAVFDRLKQTSSL